MLLDSIRIVLVNTSHPGNIGAAARAMKTMGLHRLYLVSPKDYPHPKALEMASGAQEVLEQAQVVPTVEEAIQDCTLVLGTSTRLRTIPLPLLTPRKAAALVSQEQSHSEKAILFGREQTGLTNDELRLCHCHIQIPANPSYSSLNLAQAVQVIAYELYLSKLPTKEEPQWDYPLATSGQMEQFYTHLKEVLIDLDFLKLSAPRQLMPRLKRLFNRSRPDQMEMNILRGVLSTISERIKK